jgi:hypothetical protein
MSTLTERIQAQAAALAQRSITENDQSPFWQDGFGARGREMVADEMVANQGHFHLDRLVQALLAEDPGVMTDYARELRTQIVSRGMCSRHIDANFERLERALAELVPESGPARELVRAARRALVYERGPARELQLLAEALAERTLDALWTRQTGWFAAASSYASLASFESITQAERARWKSDVLEHLSFLADALHEGRPQLFSDHAIWVRGFFERRHSLAARMEETLLALADCLPPPAAPSPAQRGPSHQPATSSLRPPTLRPPSLRPRLSEPPAPPIPLPMSAELAENARALIKAALEQLARAAEKERAEAADAAPRPAGGVEE